MSFRIYFGVPGSGKTTLAARIVLNNLKQGVVTFSNVPIKGSVLIDSKIIGQVDISDGDLIIDEAGIEYNNRAYKSLPKEQISWFKYYRHYGIRNVYVFSQSYDDMDITLRRLADQIYVVKRTLIPYLFCTRRISVKVGIDDETHQITDMYFFQFLGFNFYWGFHYWHMFDSWSAPVLPSVSWSFSSFSDYTIDRKHSRLIYRKLSRSGKLWFKLFSLFQKVFRKNNP